MSRPSHRKPRLAGGALSERRALAPEHEIDSGENGIEQALGNVPGPFGQEPAVDRDNSRNIRHGIFRQSGRSRVQADVTGRVRQPEIARQRDSDNRGDLAPIEGIALHDQDGPPKAFFRWTE